MNYLIIFIGGGVGSILRYLIGQTVLKYSQNLFLSTFISNILACLIFAIYFKISTQFSYNEQTKLLILTGFCGGLSTFSTFGFETFVLLKQQHYLFAFLNVIVSIGIALAMFYFISKKSI